MRSLIFVSAVMATSILLAACAGSSGKVRTASGWGSGGTSGSAPIGVYGTTDPAAAVSSTAGTGTRTGGGNADVSPNTDPRVQEAQRQRTLRSSASNEGR